MTGHFSVMEFDIVVDTNINAGSIGLSAADVLEFRAGLDRAELSIDKEARTINNVILARVQEARGHGVEIEQSFLTDMHKYVTKSMGDRVQSNFGHRWNSLGFQLGYFTDLRIKDDQYVGKLTVYKAADKSPEMKGMAEWFFEIAEEDPKSVMCSIKFEPAHYYQYDDKGTKVIIEYSWWSGPVKAFANKPAYVAFKRLISCDIVDEGALTDSLFASNQPGAAKMFADIVNAPGFIEFMRENHQHFPQLQSFYRDLSTWSVGKFFQNIFSKNTNMNTDANAPEQTPSTQDAAESTTPAAEVGAAEAQGAPTVDYSTTIQSLQETISQLQTRISELEGQPAAEHTPVVAPEVSGVVDEFADKPWLNSPMNKRVRKTQR